MDSKKCHPSTDYKGVRNCLREPRHRADLFKVKHKEIFLCVCVCVSLSIRHRLKDVCKRLLLVETECKKTTKKTVKKK